jgi:anti-sigma B factor antagonist
MVSRRRRARGADRVTEGSRRHVDRVASADRDPGVAGSSRERATIAGMTVPSTSSSLDVTLRTLDDGITLVCLTGDLDALSVSRLREVIGRLVPGDDTVFDLSGVPFIDSAGLGALIAGVRRVRESGARAMVVSSRANVVRLLRVTGFDRIAPVHPSLDEAIAV